MSRIALAPSPALCASAGPSVAGGLLPRLASRYLAWRRRRATIAMLHGLDSRTLKDIGLARSEIESAVNTHGAGRRLRFADGTGRHRSI